MLKIIHGIICQLTPPPPQTHLNSSNKPNIYIPATYAACFFLVLCFVYNSSTKMPSYSSPLQIVDFQIKILFTVWSPTQSATSIYPSMILPTEYTFFPSLNLNSLSAVLLCIIVTWMLFECKLHASFIWVSLSVPCMSWRGTTVRMVDFWKHLKH